MKKKMNKKLIKIIFNIVLVTAIGILGIVDCYESFARDRIIMGSLFVVLLILWFSIHIISISKDIKKYLESKGDIDG